VASLESMADSAPTRLSRPAMDTSEDRKILSRRLSLDSSPTIPSRPMGCPKVVVSKGASDCCPRIPRRPPSTASVMEVHVPQRKESYDDNIDVSYCIAPLSGGDGNESSWRDRSPILPKRPSSVATTQPEPSESSEGGDDPPVLVDKSKTSPEIHVLKEQVHNHRDSSPKLPKRLPTGSSDVEMAMDDDDDFALPPPTTSSQPR